MEVQAASPTLSDPAPVIALHCSGSAPGNGVAWATRSTRTAS